MAPVLDGGVLRLNGGMMECRGKRVLGDGGQNFLRGNTCGRPIGSQLDGLPGFSGQQHGIRRTLHVNGDGNSGRGQKTSMAGSGILPGLGAVDSKPGSSSQVGNVRYFLDPFKLVAKEGIGLEMVSSRASIHGSICGEQGCGDMKTGVNQELKSYFPGIGKGPSTTNFDLWPVSVAARWKKVNRNKSPNELAVLSWNTNGRLDLRGCRESLLRRWATNGFVDLGLIQEHFKKEGMPLYNLFGPAWWNLSSGAIGESRGRRSGGCAIFCQPSLVTNHGFQQKGGRICGLFSSGGLVLSIYFPTKGQKQSMNKYRETYKTFVDDLINVLERSISGHPVAWILCGADLNAHFKGCGLPPRRKDDYAARQVRRFMLRFRLVSLSLEICPDRYTCMNSRGGSSCVDTFLVSSRLYESGGVSMYEVLDFIEHGSDHSPVYVRLKIYPSWSKRSIPPRRRILKSSGIKSLRKQLSGDSRTKQEIILKILGAFKHLDWSKAVTRKDMNNLWGLWVNCYDSLIEEIIGTRWARVSS